MVVSAHPPHGEHSPALSQVPNKDIRRASLSIISDPALNVHSRTLALISRVWSVVHSCCSSPFSHHSRGICFRFRCRNIWCKCCHPAVLHAASFKPCSARRLSSESVNTLQSHTCNSFIFKGTHYPRKLYTKKCRTMEPIAKSANALYRYSSPWRTYTMIIRIPFG